MNQRCARAVCNADATGAFVTNVPDRTAWLVQVGQIHGAVPLCDAHLERFSVPVGWTLVDQRTPSLRPVHQPAVQAAPEPSPKTTAQSARADVPAKPAPRRTTAPAAAKSAGTKPTGTKPTGTKPTGTKPTDTEPLVAEAPDDADSHLWSGTDVEVVANAPASPLLSRAFKGPDDETGDQRRLAIFQRSTRNSPATTPDPDDELPFPPADDAPLVNGN